MKVSNSNTHYKSLLNNKRGGSNSSKKCIYDHISTEMKNECPGLKYFLEIKDKIMTNSMNIYTILGHGCDLENEVRIVPVNCEYYTSTACGLTTKNNPKLNEDFFNNTLDLNRLERYNFSRDEVRHLDGLLSDFHDIKYRNVMGLYKHSQGESYVNNKNVCFLRMGEYAGLRKMGDMIINNQKDKNFIDTNDWNIKQQPYTLEMYYLQHYAGSLFPTTLQVCKLLHQNFKQNILNNYNYSLITGHDKFKRLIVNNFSIDYASIMDYLPGKFINSSCRILCNGNRATRFSRIISDNKFVKLRRSQSNSDFLELFWDNNEEDLYETDPIRRAISL